MNSFPLPSLAWFRAGLASVALASATAIATPGASMPVAASASLAEDAASPKVEASQTKPTALPSDAQARVTADSRGFIYWCDRRATAPTDMQVTLDLMLQAVETQDCRRAHKLLSLSTQLIIPGGRLATLEPISWYPQLRRLVIRESSITDLTPLEKLTQLEILDLSGVPEVPFGLLTSDRRTHSHRFPAPSNLAKGNGTKAAPAKPGQMPAEPTKQLGDKPSKAPVGDFSVEPPPAELGSTRPFVWGNVIQPAKTNQITDLTPLSKLTLLRELHLGGNSITSIRPLRELKNLEVLSLHSNPLKYLDSLEHLPRLTSLDVNSVGARNLWPVTKLRNLRRLNLANNNITDARLVIRLQRLEMLDLSMNKIEDLGPLRQLYGLRWLSLDHNQIKDLRPIGHAFALEALYVRDNEIRSLQPVSGMSRLRELMAWDNPLVRPQCPVRREDQTSTLVCQFTVPGGVY